jgi:hypothetical protein
MVPGIAQAAMDQHLRRLRQSTSKSRVRSAKKRSQLPFGFVEAPLCPDNAPRLSDEEIIAGWVFCIHTDAARGFLGNEYLKFT